MKQLVELQSHAGKFKQLGAEVVFVYREEREGLEGLQKIKEKFDPPYRLALDFEKKSSRAYSPEAKTFDNYVIDSSGTVRGVVGGTVTSRAKAEQLLKILNEINHQTK